MKYRSGIVDRVRRIGILLPPNAKNGMIGLWAAVRNSLRNRTGDYFGGTGSSGAGTGNFTCQTEITTE
jgi:hypothetical protein